jgi:hypothetical protein
MEFRTILLAESGNAIFKRAIRNILMIGSICLLQAEKEFSIILEKREGRLCEEKNTASFKL